MENNTIVKAGAATVIVAAAAVACAAVAPAVVWGAIGAGIGLGLSQR